MSIKSSLKERLAGLEAIVSHDDEAALQRKLEEMARENSRLAAQLDKLRAGYPTSSYTPPSQRREVDSAIAETISRQRDLSERMDAVRRQIADVHAQESAEIHAQEDAERVELEAMSEEALHAIQDRGRERIREVDSEVEAALKESNEMIHRSHPDYDRIKTLEARLAGLRAERESTNRRMEMAGVVLVERERQKARELLRLSEGSIPDLEPLQKAREDLQGRLSRLLAERKDLDERRFTVEEDLRRGPGPMPASERVTWEVDQRRELDSINSVLASIDEDASTIQMQLDVLADEYKAATARNVEAESWPLLKQIAGVLTELSPLLDQYNMLAARHWALIPGRGLIGPSRSLTPAVKETLANWAKGRPDLLQKD